MYDDDFQGLLNAYLGAFRLKEQYEKSYSALKALKRISFSHKIEVEGQTFFVATLLYKELADHEDFSERIALFASKSLLGHFVVTSYKEEIDGEKKHFVKFDSEERLHPLLEEKIDALKFVESKKEDLENPVQGLTRYPLEDLGNKIDDFFDLISEEQQETFSEAYEAMMKQSESQFLQEDEGLLSLGLSNEDLNSLRELEDKLTTFFDSNPESKGHLSKGDKESLMKTLIQRKEEIGSLLENFKCLHFDLSNKAVKESFLDPDFKDPVSRFDIKAKLGSATVIFHVSSLKNHDDIVETLWVEYENSGKEAHITAEGRAASLYAYSDLFTRLFSEISPGRYETQLNWREESLNNFAPLWGDPSLSGKPVDVPHEFPRLFQWKTHSGHLNQYGLTKLFDFPLVTELNNWVRTLEHPEA